MLTKDVATIARAHNAGAGGQLYPIPGVMIKKLQALVHYSRNKRNRGQLIDAEAVAKWTRPVIGDCIDLVNKDEASVDETPLSMSPGPIQVGVKWTA